MGAPTRQGSPSTVCRKLDRDDAKLRPCGGYGDDGNGGTYLLFHGRAPTHVPPFLSVFPFCVAPAARARCSKYSPWTCGFLPRPMRECRRPRCWLECAARYAQRRWDASVARTTCTWPHTLSYGTQRWDHDVAHWRGQGADALHSLAAPESGLPVATNAQVVGRPLLEILTASSTLHRRFAAPMGTSAGGLDSRTRTTHE